LAAVQGYYYSNPFWGYSGPYWGPYPYYYLDTRGKIDIDDPFKTDKVYVNGAYVGIIDDVDDFMLDPGTYNIRVVRGGKDIVNRDFYVLSGKKIEITIDGGKD